MSRTPNPTELAQYDIVAVIPAYNEAGHIAAVVARVPDFIRTVIVVDDASNDGTSDVIQDLTAEDERVILITHEKNQGVGGALVSGFERALQLNAQIVVKIDADGQMPMEHLPRLLAPLIAGQADYCKGNRFHDFQALAQMPALRRFGNTALSFLTKAAVGYWDCFDPCNGFIAIRGSVLARLPLHLVARTFFFETSMLAELYLVGAVVRDISMPARYGDEVSHLSIRRVAKEFPLKLSRCFFRRLVLKNFLYDFSMESIFLLVGLPVLLAGVLYGGVNWLRYALADVGAPTGTVVISALLVTLGFQLLLSAVSEDLRSTPKTPIDGVPLEPVEQPARETKTPSELISKS